MDDGAPAEHTEDGEGVKRIVITWPGYTGYMGPCFKALTKLCELRVYVEPSAYEQQFDASSMSGVDFRRVEAEQRQAVMEEIRAFSPTVTLICGWSTPMSQMLARAKIPGSKVLDFDMPWEWSFRKIAARWALWPHLRHFDAAFVPGNRCARYARWLGFRGDRLVVGSNPSGWERFTCAAHPKERERFLFVGRFSEEKGLDVLLAAYAAYCNQVSDPWPLDLAGSGEALPKALPDGVSRLGFVAPHEMPRVMQEHACLILPSRWEPWGVSAAEAMSAGLLTVLSDRCGIVDDVRPTCEVRYGDVQGLAAALQRMSTMSVDARVAEGRRARAQVACYAADSWAKRVVGFCGGDSEEEQGASLS